MKVGAYIKRKARDATNLARANPRYFASWLIGSVGSYAFVGLTSYYMQKQGYSPEQIAIGTLVGKKLGYYSINMVAHSLLHKDQYAESGKWCSDMKNITKSNLIATAVNTAISLSLHDLFWMRLMKVENPLAAFLSYPVGGAISAGVKFHLDAKWGVLKSTEEKIKKGRNLEEKVQ